MSCVLRRETLCGLPKTAFTADGKHRLNNGARYGVKGFTPSGDILFDNGWTVSKDFGHLAYGYVTTSHACARENGRSRPDWPVGRIASGVIAGTVLCVGVTRQATGDPLYRRQEIAAGGGSAGPTTA